MKIKYTFDKKKSFVPISKSKWFYLEIFIFILLALYFIPDFEFLVGLFIFMSIPFLLQITLHLNYFYHDKDITLEIDYSEKKIIQHKSKNRIIEIDFDDIELIVRYQGSRYQETFGKHVIPSNFYNHTIIVGKNKKKIKFSDFIVKDFGLFPINKKLIIFPFLNLI